MTTPHSAKNFLIGFLVKGDDQGNTTISIENSVPVQQKSNTTSSLIANLKSSLSSSSTSDLNNKLSEIQTKLQGTSDTFDPTLSSYIDTVNNKIVSKVSGIFNQSSVKPSQLSSMNSVDTTEPTIPSLTPDQQEQYGNIINEVQYIYDQWSKLLPNPTSKTSLNHQSTLNSTLSSQSTLNSKGKFESIFNSSTTNNSTTNVPQFTDSQQSYIVKSLDTINEINSILTTNPQIMKFQSTPASKTNNQIEQTDNITRMKPKSLTDVSSDIDTLSQNVLSLSGNDRTLAIGIKKMAQIVTSYSKNIGSNGKEPDITVAEPPSTTTNLYSTTPTSNSTPTIPIPPITVPATGNPQVDTLTTINSSIASLQATILNNAVNTRTMRSRLRNRRNRQPAISSVNESSIETGITTLITSLQNDLAAKSVAYNTKVSSGTATLSDTTDYISQVNDINTKIASLQSNLTNLQNSVEVRPKTGLQTRMGNLGKSIGDSNFGTYVKLLLGGKPHTAAPSPKQKTTLQSELSKLSVSQPSPLVSSDGSVEGLLSALQISTSADDDNIIVNCNGILEDHPFGLTYNLSASQLSAFTDNVLDKLDNSGKIDNSSYHSYLIFIYTFLSLYAYCGLYDDNKLKINDTTFNANSIISALNPEIFTQYTSSLIPQSSMMLSPDSQSILNVTSDNSWLPKLYGSTPRNKKYQHKAVENTSLNMVFKHIIGQKQN